jgi:hypothetical protein
MKFLPITAIMVLAMSSSALAVTNTPSPVEIKACMVMSSSTADYRLGTGREPHQRA